VALLLLAVVKHWPGVPALKLPNLLWEALLVGPLQALCLTLPPQFLALLPEVSALRRLRQVAL
jgi:hypothetical protein